MIRALVTGGSGSIGAAVCKRLAADGCHVYVHARSRFAQADRLAAEIVAKGGSAIAVAFDVADRDGTGTALQKLLDDGLAERWGSASSMLVLRKLADLN